MSTPFLTDHDVPLRVFLQTVIAAGGTPLFFSQSYAKYEVYSTPFFGDGAGERLTTKFGDLPDAYITGRGGCTTLYNVAMYAQSRANLAEGVFVMFNGTSGRPFANSFRPGTLGTYHVDAFMVEASGRCFIIGGFQWTGDHYSADTYATTRAAGPNDIVHHVLVSDTGVELVATQALTRAFVVTAAVPFGHTQASVLAGGYVLKGNKCVLNAWRSNVGTWELVKEFDDCFDDTLQVGDPFALQLISAADDIIVGVARKNMGSRSHVFVMDTFETDIGSWYTKIGDIDVRSPLLFALGDATVHICGGEGVENEKEVRTCWHVNARTNAMEKTEDFSVGVL